MATLEQLVVATRARAGDPAESELPEDYVAKAVTSGLREFSRFRPLIGAVTLNTQAHVGAYALPTGVTDVTELWVMALGIAGVDDGLFDLVRWNTSGNQSWDEFLSRLERAGFKPVDDGVWDWRVVPGTPPMLHLNPVPTAEFHLVVRTELDPSFAQLRPEDEEHVIRWALALCYEYRAARRNQPVTTLPTAVGTVKLDTGTTFFEKAKELKQEFRDQLGQGSTFITLG